MPVAMSEPYQSPSHRFLRTRRNLPIYAHRVVPSIVELLERLAELLDGVGRELDDRRWSEASANLEAAARRARAPRPPPRRPQAWIRIMRAIGKGAAAAASTASSPASASANAIKSDDKARTVSARRTGSIRRS